VLQKAFHFDKQINSLNVFDGKYRICKYIWVFKNGNNIYFANLLNHSVILLSAREYSYLENLKSHQSINITSENEFISLLIHQKFFLEENKEQEQNILLNRFNTCREEARNYGVTIGLTLKCNFGCIYCYQKHEMGKINNKTINKIYNHLKLKMGTFKKFSVLWFGGEPLLCLNQITSMSKNFIDQCTVNNIPYKAHIITNGYLLTQEVSRILSELMVADIQITLDGMSKSHNISRPLLSGKGTFDKIIYNLEVATKYIPLIKVRVNISDQNINEIEDLIDVLSKIDGNMLLYFMPVQHHSFLELNKCDTMHLSNYNHWQSLIDRLERYATEQRLQVLTERHRSGLTYCNAYSKNAIIIDPLGNCYYCTGDMGRKERRIGFINESGKLIYTKKRGEYLSLNPFNNHECINCNVLPLCMGGCFKLPIENGKINGRCIQKELFPIKFPNAIFQGVKDPIAHST